MIDTVDRATRSANMSKIRSVDTKPELLVRKFLYAHGYRYRLHVKDLPGKPDIVIRKMKLAIFVHGCFWHRHQGCRLASTPSSNTEYWQSKFRKNKQRDAEVIEALRRSQWRVMIIWECGLKKKCLESTFKFIDTSLKTLESLPQVFEYPTKS